MLARILGVLSASVISCCHFVIKLRTYKVSEMKFKEDIKVAYCMKTACAPNIYRLFKKDNEINHYANHY